MDIAVTISGERAVAARLEGMPDRLHNRLVEKIGGLTQKLLARVQASEPMRTGQLKSETRAFLDETKDLVRGRVKVSAPGMKGELGKAAALEYGARNTARVRAYQRTMTQVFGHMVEPRDVMVAAYSRRVNIPAARFLRGPLDAMRDEIETEIGAAIEEAK